MADSIYTSDTKANADRVSSGLRKGSEIAGDNGAFGGPRDGAAEPSRLWSRFKEVAYYLRFLRPVRWLIVLIVTLTILADVLRLPVTFVPQQLTQHFEDKSYLLMYLSLTMLATILAGLLSLVEGYCANRMGEFLARSLRLELFAQLDRLSMLSVASRGAGQFVQRVVRDVEQIRDLFRMTLTSLITQMIQVSILVITMLVLEPILTLVLVGAFLLVGPFIKRVNSVVESLARSIQDLSEQSIDQLVEAVGGFRDIQISGRFERFYARFEGVVRETEKTCVRAGWWAHAAGTFPTVAGGILVVVPYFLAVRRLDSVAGAGEVITYVALLSQVMPLFAMMARSSSLLARTTPALREVRRLLSSSSNIGESGGEALRPLLLPIQSIRFEGVGIQLGGRWVLRNLNFEIPAGKFTAIVGQSGSGKTTIFMMLVRLLEPTEGRILINDCPLSTIPLEQLRGLIGYIPQNPFIFNQSLRENLLMSASDTSATNGLLNRIVETAQLTEVIQKRASEGGLAASAGHLGSRLSGGERQRIALGRLLIQDPQIIVCDEYTANIDVKTARIIDDTIHSRFPDRTRVVITHALYTISGADHIVVVDNGTVAQTGRHTELVEVPGLYRELWEVQTLAS